MFQWGIKDGGHCVLDFFSLYPHRIAVLCVCFLDVVPVTQGGVDGVEPAGISIPG